MVASIVPSIEALVVPLLLSLNVLLGLPPPLFSLVRPRVPGALSAVRRERGGGEARGGRGAE